MYQEYLALFSNSGDFTIQVRFDGSDSFIADQKMSASEILSLVDQSGERYISKMRFDGHLAEIEKITIFQRKRRVVLYARLDQGLQMISPNLAFQPTATGGV